MEPMGTLGGSAARCFQQLKGELSDGVSGAVGVYLMPSESPGYCPSSVSSCSSRAAHHGFLGRVEGSGRLWRCPAQLWKPSAPSLPSLFLMREVTSPEGLSWPWAVPPWGKLAQVKWNCYAYPFQCVQSQISFCSSGELAPPLWPPGLPHRHARHGWWSKPVFCGR